MTIITLNRKSLYIKIQSKINLILLLKTYLQLNKINKLNIKIDLKNKIHNLISKIVMSKSIQLNRCFKIWKRLDQLIFLRIF